MSQEIKLSSKWLKKSTPTELINIIRNNFDITSEGRVSYKIESTFYFDALFSLVIHSHDIDNETLYKYFETSLQSCFKKDKISKPDDILIEFDRTANINKRTSNNYTLITSINIKNIYSIPQRKIHNCTIAFHNTLPKKYQSSRSKQLARHIEYDFKEQENFTFITVKTKAINEAHAFKNAMQATDIFRAILQIGFKKNIQLLSTHKEDEYPTKSIIQYGQVHTLHSDSGKSAHNEIWYEPKYQSRNALTLKAPERTITELTKKLDKFKKSPYQEHVISAMTSYADAIDSVDIELRFMKLWSTLEKLTMTDDSTKLIKRTAFFYQERALHEKLLESLRCSRNTHIHGGNKPINLELKNYQLCSIIEHLINFTLANPFKLSNRQQIENLISFPTESKTLKAQISTLKMVQKFIGDQPN